VTFSIGTDLARSLDIILLWIKLGKALQGLEALEILRLGRPRAA
jgi:hypothetical protein